LPLTSQRKIAGPSRLPTNAGSTKIGLGTSVLEAEKLAWENARPIFLFTHDGKMNVGRC